jgi:polar amino acid transport system permease protein
MRAPAALALLALLLLAGCGGNYNWGWYVVLPTTKQGVTNIQFMLGGLGWTLALSFLAMAISIVLGMIVALPAIGRNRWGHAVNRVYVELVRSVPVLVMLLWVYYGLPVVLGISLGAFSAGIIALAISDSAFEAEIFRGGIQSVAKGQHEAADALGLPWADKMRFVILPQAIRRMLPPLGNQFVYMLKMSSLCSVIGLTELTRKANELVVTLYRPLEIYTFLVLEYLVLILIVSFAVRRLERRLGSDERRAR